MADRDAGHPQNTQYHTGYILGEVLMSVRHALLALLSEGPKYGLQLRQEFESGTGEVWPLNVGQVYTTLQRLERDGLVASTDGEDESLQKGYRITPADSRELAA
jgi:DNA-binding PadR family transcriptional regulator